MKMHVEVKPSPLISLWEKSQQRPVFVNSSVYQYNTAADSTLPSVLKTSSDQGEVAPTPIVEKQDSVEASSVGKVCFCQYFCLRFFF